MVSLKFVGGALLLIHMEIMEIIESVALNWNKICTLYGGGILPTDINLLSAPLHMVLVFILHLQTSGMTFYTSLPFTCPSRKVILKTELRKSEKSKCALQ